MTFHILQKFNKIDPGRIEDNFNHVLEGDWIPRNGVSLAAIDSTLDLGSAENIYNNVHINDISVPSQNPGIWNLIYEETLAATAATIDVTGLNGDTDEIYMIQYESILDSAPSGAISLKLEFNNDSGTNYGYQELVHFDTSILASRSSSRSWVRMGRAFNATTTGVNTGGELFIYAKTGNERLILNNFSDGTSGKYINAEWHSGGIWNDTTSTLTSMQIYWASGFHRTNTTIKIWAPR